MITGEDVQLQFHDSFIESGYWLPNMQFDVRFVFTMIPMRRSHYALDMLTRVPIQYRFPTNPPQIDLANLRKKGSFYDMLGTIVDRPVHPIQEHGLGFKDLNVEQKAAVRNVVYKTHGPAPFV
jgi:hypothetical protein